MTDIIIGVVALAVVLLFFLYQNPKTKRYKLPPGPTALPVIGNLHQLQKLNPQRFFYGWAQKYGPILSYKIGSRTMVVISSAELTKELLKTQDVNFTDRPQHRSHEIISYGRRGMVLSHYTPYYREIRKIAMNHLFSPTRVATFKHVREEEVRRMMVKINKAAEKSEAVDISELMMTFGNSVVCRQAFGKKYNEDGEEMKMFIKIVYGIQNVLGKIYFSDIFPFTGYVLDDLIGLTAYMNECFERQDTYLQEIIDETLNPNRLKPETESMIDLLMGIYKDQPLASDFTIENVKAVILDIITGGTETAAAAVVWGMTYLIKYPQVMEKAQAEVRNYIKEKGLTFVTEDDVKNLPYFRALVKETLRIEPVIPLLIPRSCIQDTKIAGYDIPAGTTVNVNAWAVSRDEEWGPNADEFRPERFLEKKVDFKGTDYEFIPFGSGRRMCPGMRLGAAMLEVPYANLLLNFDFKLPNGMKPEEINMDVMTGFAMHKSEHLMLVPEKVWK